MATILIADDEVPVRSALRLILESQGHRVHEAGDGAQAVECFRRVRPDLVVTDLLMPVKGGINTIGEMRELSPDVPIVAISGGGQGGGFNLLAVARTFPGVRVLRKPFEWGEFLAVVNDLLPCPAPAPGGTERPAEPPPAPVAQPAPAKAPAAAPAGLHTLIVEDDFVSRRVLQAILAPFGPCEVAVNGREAVQAFRLALADERPYDLVCLDIMMPEMDGRQVLREIRRLEEERRVGGREGVKVVMTTALGDFDTIMGSFRDQCEAYLVKPIHKVELLNTVRGLGLIP